MKKILEILRKIAIVVSFSYLLVVLSACAETFDIKKTESHGFSNGLWHGITLPVSFVGSLTSDNISIYGVNNNGWRYDSGFVLGAAMVFMAIGRGTSFE